MRDPETTRDRLLRLARDLYLDHGPARFSLREVARRARLSPAAVYRHFADREALLREVCAAGFQTFASYLLQALAAPTARARLDASATQYMRFGLENPRDYRVIFMGDAELAARSPAPAGPENDPTFRFLVDRVREGESARILRRGARLHTATVIWAHVHGLVSLRLSGHFRHLGDDETFARFYHQSVGHLLDGLAP